jgi:tryptophanyl-tRNA synthetase
VLKQFGGQPFSAFKPALAELAIAKLTPITSEMKRMMTDDRSYIDAVLERGAQRARAIADPVLAHVREIVGFI